MHPINPEELTRALKAHEVYVETGQRSGQRAYLDANNLSGKSFAGMKLWHIRMQRADLAGKDFKGALASVWLWLHRPRLAKASSSF